MAQSMNRSVSAQESSIHQDEESRYECPICINWLTDPILTPCGHKFCNKCIISWLEKDKQGSCPVDKLPLDKKDLFLDKSTLREIKLIKKPCQNASLGCVELISPVELDRHLLNCRFNEIPQNQEMFTCLFSQCGCGFKGSSKDSLDEHLKSDFGHHLNLLLSTFQKSETFREMDNKLWDPPNKKANGNGAASQTDLTRAMYERIVCLEQSVLEQNVKIENLLSQQMALTCRLSNIQAKFSDGVLVWRIDKFEDKVRLMRSNSNLMYYSNEAFTSPQGYKFCARINISPKDNSRDYLGLHIHMMQSENDFHLDWPFKGRIKILMVHPIHLTESQSDTIMTKPEIQAFYRPQQEISPRGFGFVEYACISDIMKRRFVASDTLTIKIQINIV